MAEEVHYLSLLEVSERIKTRDLTSTAVTENLLERIGRLDGQFHSILSVLTDTALAAAKQADAEIASGLWRGPLHGVPIGLKDLLYTRGLPTTAGMALLKDFRPDHDATVVTRLKRAGAVLIAKLHMTEGATMDHHPSLPRPTNPWSAAHWTGVSSSGSGVAPAAGFCYGALGTDTGGSIRMPSAANNLTGVKPTWGRVSRHGLIHLAESMDHIGPMARSAGDAAAILQVIAGADPDDPTTLSAPVPDYLGGLTGGVSDLVIGVDWSFATDGAAPQIVQAVKNALDVLQSLGARVREITFPDTTPVATQIMPLLIAEVAAAHADFYPGNAQLYGPRLRAMIDNGLALDNQMVVRAYQARSQFNGRLDAVLRDVDLIIAPGLGMILPTWDEIEAMGDDLELMGRTLMKFTTPFNVAGVPTISLPGGFTDSGLPVGIQLIAKRLDEPLLCRAGHAFQTATSFHIRRALS